MPTFDNREAMSSVRAKINAAIEKIDDLDTAQAVTPQMYGALGNDTGDDTAALQAAIDACKAAGTTDGSGGKRLYIPPGTYRHTGLTVDRPITIEGAGGRRTRLRKIGNSTAPSVMIAPAHDGVDYVASTSLFANIKIKGIHLIGAGKDNIGGADGWRIQNATTNPIYTEVILEDISAWAHAGNGLKGQTFAGPVRIYDINMSNNNLCGAEINSCVDWRIFGGEMGSNTLDSLQIAGCVQMRIYGLYVYSGGRFTANLFNSQVMWHGGAIDASATHGLNYDCRREFDYCKLIDVDFRKNGFNSSPNTYADIYVSSLATSELYLQNCGFEYPNNGSSLYNIQFQGSGNYVYEAGSRFEGGDVNAANVTNAPNQLRSVGRHMYSKGDRNYATLATDVVSNEQYTGLRLTNDFVPVVALYGTTGANAGGVLDIYQPDGIEVGQRLAAPGTGVPSLITPPGPYDDDADAIANGLSADNSYRQTGGGVAYVGGGASGGSINANTVYASRAAAIAATIPATQNSLRLYHLGVLLEYKREAGVISNPALTTNGGAVYWSPAGVAYVEHYGSDAAAITAMMAAQGHVNFLTGFAVTSDVTIEGPCQFADWTAWIDVAAGMTVTFRGLIDARPDQWILRGDGDYDMSLAGFPGAGSVNARNLWAHWAGVMSAADNTVDMAPRLNKLLGWIGGTENIINFLHGRYAINTAVDPLPRGTWIKGSGERRTILSIGADGFDVFTTADILCRFSEFNFELDGVLITWRASGAYIRALHDQCTIEKVRAGAADLNFVLEGSYCLVDDVSGFWGSVVSAGSSLVLNQGSYNRIARVASPTTTSYAPGALVHVGGAGAGGINGTDIEGVFTRSPGISVLLDAVDGYIRDTQISDLQDYITSGTPAALVKIVATGFEVSNTRIDEWRANSLHTDAIVAHAVGANIDVLNIGQGRASGSTGSGLKLTADATRTITGIVLGGDADIWNRATPISKAGAGTIAKPAAWPLTAMARLAQLGMGKNVTIADDAVYTIDFQTSVFYGLLMLSTNSASSIGGLWRFRAASSPFMRSIAEDGAVTETTGALTGTTGVDGAITISADSTGKLYIENRSGASVAFGVILLQTTADFEFA